MVVMSALALAETLMSVASALEDMVRVAVALVGTVTPRMMAASALALAETWMSVGTVI